MTDPFSFKYSDQRFDLLGGQTPAQLTCYLPPWARIFYSFLCCLFVMSIWCLPVFASERHTNLKYNTDKKNITAFLFLFCSFLFLFVFVCLFVFCLFICLFVFCLFVCLFVLFEHACTCAHHAGKS